MNRYWTRRVRGLAGYAAFYCKRGVEGPRDPFSLCILCTAHATVAGAVLRSIVPDGRALWEAAGNEKPACDPCRCPDGDPVTELQQQALDASKSFGDIYVGTEHFLIATARSKYSSLGKALQCIGVAVEDVAEAVKAYQEQNQSALLRSPEHARRDCGGGLEWRLWYWEWATFSEYQYRKKKRNEVAVNSPSEVSADPNGVRFGRVFRTPVGSLCFELHHCTKEELERIQFENPGDEALFVKMAQFVGVDRCPDVTVHIVGTAGGAGGASQVFERYGLPPSFSGGVTFRDDEDGPIVLNLAKLHGRKTFRELLFHEYGHWLTHQKGRPQETWPPTCIVECMASFFGRWPDKDCTFDLGVRAPSIPVGFPFKAHGVPGGLAEAEALLAASPQGPWPFAVYATFLALGHLTAALEQRCLGKGGLLDDLMDPNNPVESLSDWLEQRHRLSREKLEAHYANLVANGDVL